jgi:phosphoribosylaminoimidazole-succinocarboxamide synthase
MDDFDHLPLVAEGQSKIVRYLGKGRVAIRLKPMVYSYSANRCEVVPGSDMLRLKASRILVDRLQRHGIDHAFEEHHIKRQVIISKLLLEPDPKGWHYFPQDVEASSLAVLAPIEVIVKAFHVGTPKHRYSGMNQHPTRSGFRVQSEQPYPETVVRFDWRNPLCDERGNRLADETLPDQMAAWWIDTEQARPTALLAFQVLHAFLAERRLELLDICFFFDALGRMVCSEISPDCLRVRCMDTSGSLDKDVWRAGGSSSQLLEKWSQLVERIQ